MSIVPSDYEQPAPEELVTLYSDSKGNPPEQAVRALEAGIVQVKRRVEIYESDGTTQWFANPEDPTYVPRLISGNVTLDYGSPERRKIDLSLDNTDDLLRPNPQGFWYNKILKPFWGLRWRANDLTPRAVITEGSEEDMKTLKKLIGGMGFTDVTIKPTSEITSIQDLEPYDFIFCHKSGSGTLSIADYCKRLYENGKNIVTISSEFTQGGTSSIPMVAGHESGSLFADTSWGISPARNYTPRGYFKNTTVDWSPNAGADNPVLSTVRAYEDDTSLYVSRGAGTSEYFSFHNISALGNLGEYQLKARVWIPSATNPGQVAFEIDGAGVDIPITPAHISQRNQWVDFSVKFTYLGTGEINVWIKGQDQTADAWIDNLTLLPTSYPDSPVVDTYAITQETATGDGYRVTALEPGVSVLSVWTAPDSPLIYTGILGTHPSGGEWFHLGLPSITDSEVHKLINATLDHMRRVRSTYTWEQPLGDFMPDNIKLAHFPFQVNVSARDFTKKLILSKLERSLSFASETSLKELVRAVAINGGIAPDKINDSIEDETLGNEMSFEKGTPRWNIIESACKSFHYEVFFDARNNLVIRKFIDPTTGPISHTLKTGEDGNLVTWDKAINDSRIFNKIIVIGEPAEGEEDRLPYYGEARNEDPDSPTSIENMGHERTEVITTTWLTSDQECYDLAAARLKIMGLESYALNFSSMFFPWLECGEITEILDPGRLENEPTRFLLTNLNFPLDLGPMSGVGSRVTYVGSSGSPEDALTDTEVA